MVQTWHKDVHQDNAMVAGHDMWSRNQLFQAEHGKTWLEQHIVILPGTVRWYWSDYSIPETSGIRKYRLVLSTKRICEKSELHWTGSLKLRYKHCKTADCVLWDVCACTLSLFIWKIDFGYDYFQTWDYKLEQNKMYSFLPGAKFQQQNRRKSSLEPPEPRKRSLSFSAIVKATSRGSARDRRGRRKPVFVRADNQIRLRWKSKMESNYNQYELPKNRRWVSTVLLV